MFGRLAALFVFTLFLLSLTSVAQDNIFISNGSVTTCEGSFQDDNSGGAEGSPYSDTDYTFTICPDNPGDVIQVNFVAFGLQTSPNPNNSDYLSIFDGDNTGENSLGDYAGTGLQGIAVTGTVNNTSGCLTFVFTSNTGNSSSAPGWEAIISCTTPCAPPTAGAEILDPLPDAGTQHVGVCVGAPVTFGNDGSFSEPGFTLANYIWDFDDESVEQGANLTEVTHVFDEPGEYIVNLIVQDNNGCFSLNVVPMQVLVSTIPLFSTEFTEEFCLGGEGIIDGTALQSVTWTALPPQVVSGETYLADGAGFSFSSELTFDYFEPDAVLENCDDLLSIFVNIEHSYLGDLGMFIECPDGTSVNLIDWGLNGGGGTFLGECVDDGTTIAGTGYDYGWQPGLTNGNLDDNNSTSVTYTNNAGQVVTGNIVDPGFYESDEDLCNLVGCPLNGTWTFNVTDNLAIDNGYIFEWGMEFNPNLYPDVTTFTPEIGLGLDSTWWDGPFINTESPDGNIITIEPDALGDYEYTYYATNNFGCTFDTTITVSVVPGPSIDAGAFWTICDDNVQLDPNVTVDGVDADCILTLEMLDTFGDGWNGCAVDFVVDGVVIETLTLNGGLADIGTVVLPGGTTFQAVFVAGGFINEVSMNLFDDGGNIIYSGGPGGFVDGQILFEGLCGGYGDYIFEWSPSDGLSDPNVPNPLADVDTETTYTVTVYPEGYEGCAATSQTTVGLAYSYEVTGEDIPCSGDIAQIEVVLDGDADDAPWELNLILGNDTLQTINTNGGSNAFEVTDGGFFIVSVSNDACTYTTEVPVNAPPIYQLVASPDTTICINGTATLSAWATEDADTTWTYFWNNNLGIGSSIDVNPAVGQLYSVYVVDNLGCESDPVLVQVDLYDPLSVMAMEDDIICLGDVITLDEAANGGLAPYSFTWYNEQLPGVTMDGDEVDVQPTMPSTYCVQLTDACETPMDEDCVFIDIEELIDPHFVADTLADCFPVLVNFNGVADNTNIIASAEWDFGDGTHSTAIDMTAHNFWQSGQYTVSYTITSVDGCVYGDTVVDMIYAYPYPIADFTSNPELAILPNSTFEMINLSHDNDLNFWQFAEYGESTEVEPEITFPGNNIGEYLVTLIVTNEFGCQDSISKELTVLEDFVIYAPNAFTPDHDGFNDFWFVQGIDVDPDRYEINVFNRWGDSIFQSYDLDAVWDGSDQGGDYFVPDGVYPFLIVAHSLTTGELKRISGSVTVIR
jgi:gliding motility-associated-like protein